MTTTRRGRRIAKTLLACAALGLLLAACKNVGPMDALNPEGPIARRQHGLFVPVFWIAAAMFVLVEGGIVFAVLKFRDRRNAAAPVQIHGNTRLELGWTIAPAVLLGVIAIPVVVLIFSLAEVPRGPDVVHVRVTGHQWWWEYEYLDADPVVATANEMVIPTGRRIAIEVTSDDVIHSFWVPKLGGKQDAIPGRSNPLTLVADKTGTYYGQCAEFCALSHANMKLRVVAMPPAEFDRWLAGQQRPAAVPPTGAAAQGAT
ncbi:MAG: cytochrome c oxidase subunit II, partial [Actinomycetota bacterium]